MSRLALLILSSVLFAGAAFAQSSGAADSEPFRLRVFGPALGPAGPENIWMLQDGAGGERAAREVLFWSIVGDQEVIKNAPYTGTVVNESTQTLSDGNRIISKSSGFQARDGQGRTRREETLEKVGPLPVEAPKIIFISDPVAHTNYVLRPDARTVHAMNRDENASGNIIELKKKLENLTNVAAGRERRLNRVANEENKADVKHEDLGMQDVEGVACHGTRETVTIPAGQVGNERPIVITTETWTSDDLHGIVLKKHNDPRSGETVYRLTNIKLGEPDTSLFQPPNGFKIIKNESSFSYHKD
jgi:hypothetical protein